MLLLVIPFPARVRIGSVNRIFLLWWHATVAASDVSDTFICWALQIYTVRHLIQLQIIFFWIFSVTSQFFSFIYKRRYKTWAWHCFPWCHTLLPSLPAWCLLSQWALSILAGVIPGTHKSFPCGASLTEFWKSKIKQITFSCWFSQSTSVDLVKEDLSLQKACWPLPNCNINPCISEYHHQLLVLVTLVVQAPGLSSDSYAHHLWWLFYGEVSGFVVSIALARVNELSNRPPQTRRSPLDSMLQEAVKQGPELSQPGPGYKNCSTDWECWDSSWSPSRRARRRMGALALPGDPVTFGRRQRSTCPPVTNLPLPNVPGTLCTVLWCRA